MSRADDNITVILTVDELASIIDHSQVDYRAVEEYWPEDVEACRSGFEKLRTALRERPEPPCCEHCRKRSQEEPD